MLIIRRDLTFCVLNCPWNIHFSFSVTMFHKKNFSRCLKREKYAVTRSCLFNEFMQNRFFFFLLFSSLLEYPSFESCPSRVNVWQWFAALLPTFKLLFRLCRILSEQFLQIVIVAFSKVPRSLFVDHPLTWPIREKSPLLKQMRTNRKIHYVRRERNNSIRMLLQHFFLVGIRHRIQCRIYILSVTIFDSTE